MPGGEDDIVEPLALLEIAPDQQAKAAGKLEHPHQRVMLGAGEAVGAASLTQLDCTAPSGQPIEVEARALRHGTELGPPEAQRCQDAILRLAGQQPHRRGHLRLTDGQMYAVAIGHPELARERRCDQQRIVPGELGQRTRQFEQPRIVGEPPVPHMRVWSEQHGNGLIRRLRRRESRNVRA
ncbi:MAG: hypothetical protein J0H99_09075 [Rhodospirillales bacterium]|nr:hypothetical protein [Rhodospirillales bacterium]